MKPTVIKKIYHIEKGQQGKYLFVDFDCPENVARIEITYDYQRHETTPTATGEKVTEINIVDLGLHDEKDEFRGASGSNKKEIFIEENSSTPGYINGPIVPGTWRIMFGAYKIHEDGCDVEFTVTFHFKKYQWLKGDLHLHSQVSDGDYAPRDMIDLAAKMKLDYIFLTDHNNFHQNQYILPNEELAVFPGMELTLFNGHCTFLGVDKPITNFFANSKEELVGILEEARENGALIVLAHPFSEHPWAWGFDVPFDALEIQNSVFKESDQKAIDFWHEQLVAGKRIPIVGGSDNHGVRFLQTPATPTTWLYAHGSGKQGILQAIKNGNAFVSCFTDGPEIRLNIAEAVMGDVTRDTSSNVEVLVKSLKPFDEVKIITDEGVIHETRIQEEKSWSLSIPQTGAKFYRVEVWRYVLPNVRMLGAISNPVYVGEW